MKLMAELRRMHRAENGIVLPLVLVFLALGMLLITPTLGLGSTSLEGSMVNETKALELYAADAGVEDALHWLLNDDRSGGKYASSGEGWQREDALQLNGADVEVSYLKLGDNFLISSVASIGSSRTEIQALVEFIEEQHEHGGGNVFANAITTLGGDVTIGGSGNLNGDVFASGKLTLEGSKDITGNVYAGSDVQITGSGKIKGDASTPGTVTPPSGVKGAIETGIPPEDAPKLADEELAALIKEVKDSTEIAGFSAGDITRTGPWTVPSGLYSVKEHVNGNMEITSGEVTFNEAVYVDGGNLKISTSKKVTFKGHLVIDGDLSITGSGDVVFEDQIRVGGNISITGSADVSFLNTVAVVGDLKATGSGKGVVGGDVYVGGDLSLTGSKNQFVDAPAIVAMGDIKLTGSGSLNNVSDIPLVVTPHGDFSLTGSGDIWAAVYAPEATVKLTGSGKVYGAIVCDSIEITGSGGVQYLAELGERADLPGSHVGTVRPRSVKVVSYAVI